MTMTKILEYVCVILGSLAVLYCKFYVKYIVLFDLLYHLHVNICIAVNVNCSVSIFQKCLIREFYDLFQQFVWKQSNNMSFLLRMQIYILCMIHPLHDAWKSQHY